MAPIALGPVAAAQPRRLDLAPDEPRPRPPAHRRPRRLPRGAGPGRGRARSSSRRPPPTPRGCSPPTPSAGFLPEVVPAYRRLPTRSTPTAPSCFVQFNHGGREQISASPTRAHGGAVGHPQPALQVRAARAHRTPRSHELIEGYAISARHAAQGGARRRRAVDLARLPARPVPLAAVSNRRGDGWDGYARPRGCASPSRC